MAGTTSVYLIGGFLGSGKTTFLNRIIHAFPGNQKLMILMNRIVFIGPPKVMEALGKVDFRGVMQRDLHLFRMS